MGSTGNRFRRLLVCLGLKRRRLKFFFLMLFLGTAFTVFTASNYAYKHITRETISTKHTDIHPSEVVTMETDINHLQREIADKVTRTLKRKPSTLSSVLSLPSNPLDDNFQHFKYNNQDTEHSNRQAQPRFTAEEDNEHSELPESQVSTSGYMMVVFYAEQLESAMWDMYQLLHLATRWNMKLVEPFLLGSYFGIPELKATDTLLRFRDIYNMTVMNEQLRECTHATYPPIALNKEFAAQSFAGVWLLDFMRAGVPVCSAISQGREDDRLVENRINALSTKVSNGTVYQTIHISKHICIDARKAINFEKLPYSLGITVPNPDMGTNDKKRSSHTGATEQVAVLFRRWTGIRNQPDKFFYHDPDFHTPECPHIHTLEHSGTVKAAAQMLFAHLRLTRPLLGIHIRLERFMKLDVEKPGTTEECLRKLMNTVKALKVKYSLRDGQVLALRDYGVLGSQSCKRRNCNKIATHLQIDAQLTALGVRLADYNPAVLQIPNHSGLASTVEKELISTSDYLLTVGWGSFQRSIRDRILKSHPGGGVERVYSLCSGDGDTLPNLIIDTY